MAKEQGKFAWCELMTTDTEAATEFYCAVIGWTAADSGLTDRSYTILNAGESPTAGLMPVPPGARPGWLGYIAVDDVDAFVARTSAAGGGVHHPAADIPGVGRFAVVHDPQGAVFVLFTPLDASMAPPPAGSTPGRVGWHELHASDREAALNFYAGLFGWTKGEAIDMGAMGIYQLFATGDVAVGGMVTKHAAIPAPFWLYYFNVDNIDTAVIRAKESGGQLLNGPHQVPGGSWIAHCRDPQGAMFAIVAPPA